MEGGRIKGTIQYGIKGAMKGGPWRRTTSMMKGGKMGGIKGGLSEVRDAGWSYEWKQGGAK